MVDPIVMAIVSAAAGKGAETLISDARSALGALFRMVRGRLGGGDSPTSPFDAFLVEPADSDRRDALISALSREITDDPQFADALRGQLRLARAEIDGSVGGVRNEFHGSAGTVIQSRDISGGITF